MLQKRAEVLKAKLVKERKKYNSDAEFAAAIGGVKPGTLNKWLKSDPPVWPERHLEEIAAYFKTDIEGLTDDRAKLLRAKEKSAPYKLAKEAIQDLRPMENSEKIVLAKLLLEEAIAV